MSNTAAISVRHVTKRFRLYHERNQYLKAAILRGRRARYEEFRALDNVSFEVERSQTFGIVGSNGSGKSTMLKCIAGILHPESGNVTVRGRQAALLELGAGFHLELSGRENTYLNGAILGMSRKEIDRRFDEIVDFAGLGDFIDTPVKNYSSGMAVRLGFAIATNVEPEILLIDEVLAVGDAAFQRKCAEKIAEIRASGRTILLVSHAEGTVAQLCDQALWLEKGQVQMVGPAKEVVNAYTGASHDAVAPTSDEIGQRWGSFEAQITAIELRGSGASAQATFTTGQPMTIRLQIAAHEPIPDATVGVQIDTLQGVPLWGTSTRRKGQPIDLVGACSVEFAIPELALLEGVYNLTAEIADRTGAHAYDHWGSRVRFEVHQQGVYDRHSVYMPSTLTTTTSAT